MAARNVLEEVFNVVAWQNKFKTQPPEITKGCNIFNRKTWIPLEYTAALKKLGNLKEDSKNQYRELYLHYEGGKPLLTLVERAKKKDKISKYGT